MAVTYNQPAGICARLRGNVSARFVRFAGVAAAALTTSLIAVGVCDGVWHLTSVPTALISQVAGAIVSYLLSRWAWERKGKPDVLRETIPFWIAFAVATVISTLFTKLGYRMSAWMHLRGVKDVLVVESVYLVGNIITFLMRFVFFHFVLFADRTTVAKEGTAAPGIPAAGALPSAPAHAHAMEPAAPDVAAMSSAG